MVKYYFHAAQVPRSEARTIDHVTFSNKTQVHLDRDTHVACHSHFKDHGTLEFQEATHAAEKADSTMKRDNKPVWPDDEDRVPCSQVLPLFLECVLPLVIMPGPCALLPCTQ
ncbi:hypothetical protein X797_008425 [Metarhizium robertsii]|uniref:Uncharacterized protein n=1 Tax=Metarhizium robertsii TaxID=568076 RepID=A0A0A1UR77_9HYPO|nr:hypothetical protein X797_008425 [Metarhizium robertsii]